ncbi:MAG: DNA-binding transcriptional regulator [Pirellulales bacterium]|nr:DNA-binding transcriptional regulator [Pirellulales bacterium]
MAIMPQSRKIPQVLLLIETSRAYGRGLIEGITRYAEENGPWSLFFEERGLTDPLPRWFHDWRGNGIISHCAHKHIIDKLLATRLPVVELLYSNPDFEGGLVRPDDDAVARLAADHFFDCGLRHYAYFCTDRVYCFEVRRQAFERILRERGHPCHHFDFTPRSKSSGRKRLQIEDAGIIRWLRRLPKPCGVFCATDFYAMRLASACRICGIVVPDQIAVLGVDNDSVFCGVCFPRLSSIDLGSARIGYEAAAMLDRMMAGNPPPEGGTCVEPLQLVTRESTDILAIDDADIAKAVRMIREQACQHLRVAQVAEVLGLSCRVFEQRFQRVLHRSPKDELRRVQMERAKLLLATTNMAVAQVAKKSGFTSLEYFTRAFRRHTGMTARTYRKERRMTGGITPPQ